jgi:preprotein translocase subunit YajC
MGAEALYSAPSSEGQPQPAGRTAASAFSNLDRQDPTLMFITPAYAQGLGGGSDMFVQFVPILLMFVIFYFLLLRPQQQRVKLHREMVANLRRGDMVVTSGGIIGKVTKVRDDAEIEVEIADNTRVRVIKGTVSEVRAKGEAAKETA